MPVERVDWIEAVKREPAKYLKTWNDQVTLHPSLAKIVGTFGCSMGTARKLGIIAVAAYQALQAPKPPVTSYNHSEDPTHLLDVLMSGEDPTA